MIPLENLNQNAIFEVTPSDRLYKYLILNEFKPEQDTGSLSLPDLSNNNLYQIQGDNRRERDFIYYF